MRYLYVSAIVGGGEEMHCMVEKAGIFVVIDEWVAGSFVCESWERARGQVRENG